MTALRFIRPIIRRRAVPIGIGTLMIVFGAAGPEAPSASAKTFVVNKRGDPPPEKCTKGHCTLREAVIRANKDPNADRIVLPKRKPYRLRRLPDPLRPEQTGDLNVTGPVTIAHSGRGRAKIDAGCRDRIFDSDARLALRKLVLRGGCSEGSGGAILSRANLRVIRSRVVDNESAAGAGGIRAGLSATVTLRRTTIARNSANGRGGGVSFNGERLRIVVSRIAGNHAGCEGVCVAIEPLEGGGIYSSSPATIRRSTISGNVANDQGGGIANADELTVVNSTIAGNRTDASGGGIYGAPGTLTGLNGVTIARNRADADNSDPDSGGGIYADGGSDVVEARNTLLARNRATDGSAQDCFAPAPVGFTSLGGNLVTSAAGNCDAFFNHPEDLLRPQPRIGKLRRNGGPTATIALRKGSPAINQADAPGAPKRDQRGVRRANPDIGAYERR